MEQWREDLITKNTKLVYFCWERYIQKTLFTTQNKDDFIQEGMIGLYKASQTYKPENKTAFSSYAVMCILNQMRMYLRNDKKNPTNKTISLDAEVQSAENITIEDTIASNGSVEDKILLKQILEYVNKTQKPRKFLMFTLWLEGRPHQEIGKLLGVSRLYVNKVIHQIRKNIKEYFNK